MKKNKIFKVLLIIVDICAIAVIAFLYLNSKEKANQNITPNTNNTNNSNVNKAFTFKKYTYYNIPSNLTFIKYLDDTSSTDEAFNKYAENMFKIKGDNWYATVEIMLDPDGYLFKYNKYYESLLISAGYEIKKTSFDNINNNTVIMYETVYEGKNSVLCDYTNKENFAYEIEIYNDDNSYSTEHLEEIIKILDNGKYDSQSTEKYFYVYPFMDWTPSADEE